MSAHKHSVAIIADENFLQGETATGLVINVDRSCSMVVLRMLSGARGWLSTYELTDVELDKLSEIPSGLPLSGIVDRVEMDADGHLHVILKRETPVAIAL